MLNIREYIAIDPEHKIERVDESNKLHLGQEEKIIYKITDSHGEQIGSIKVTEHTSIKKPFNTTYLLTHYDNSGNTINQKRVH